MFDGFSTGELAIFVLAMLGTGAIAGIVAGLLGVGGGIVIVPVLAEVLEVLDVEDDVAMHVAVGTSLAIIIPTSISSALAHYKKGAVDMDLLRSVGPSVFIGVLIGAIIAGVVAGEGLKLVFAVTALLVAGNMILRPNGFFIRDGLPGGAARDGIAGAIGAISVMMGIGGGTLSVPTFTLFNIPVHRAVATGAALGLIISVPGAIGFLLNGLGAEDLPPFSIGYVNLIGAALIAPISMSLAPYGSRIAHAISPRALRLAFGIFLLITSLRMFWKILT